jgi:hypothetical protein
LFAKVANRLLDAVVQQVAEQHNIIGNSLTSEMKSILNIGIWMLTSGESPSKMGIDGSLMKVLTGNFVKIDGVSGDSAEILSFITLSIICAGQIVPMLGIDVGQANFESVNRLWRHLVKLLADTPI